MAEVVAKSPGRPRHHLRRLLAPRARAGDRSSPSPRRTHLEIAQDARLIEAENHFQGLKFGVGDGSLRHPRHWPKLVNPFRPSWGEPYKEQAVRMLGAVESAKDLARGHEAVCVSHQLPIWTLRCFLEGRRLWHDPRKRECTPRIGDDGALRGRPRRGGDLRRARASAASSAGASTRRLRAHEAACSPVLGAARWSRPCCAACTSSGAGTLTGGADNKMAAKVGVTEWSPGERGKPRDPDAASCSAAGPLTWPRCAARSWS